MSGSAVLAIAPWAGSPDAVLRKTDRSAKTAVVRVDQEDFGSMLYGTIYFHEKRCSMFE
jgi:hypothetical protein